MKNIIIDISSLLNSNFVTGIQRVVLEWSKRLIFNYPNNVFLLMRRADNLYISKSYPNNVFDDFYNLKHEIQYKKWKVEQVDSSYIFLDIDSVWGNDLNRMSLYSALKQRGTQIVSLINDIIPIENPQFLRDFVLYPSFINYLNAIMHYSDYVLFSSKSTMSKCKSLFNSFGHSKKYFVVPFGSDPKDKPDNRLTSGEKKFLDKISKKQYLLAVGTIEPRKNYDYLLDSFSLIGNNQFNLVIVGRVGWKCSSFLKKLQKNGLYNKQIFVNNNVSDALLVMLYKKCWAFVMPSFDEGFGLPLIEAASHGNLIFCSDIPVFRETLNNKAIYFDNKNSTDLVNKIKHFASHPKSYLVEKNIIKHVDFLNWDESFLILVKALKL